MSNVNFSSFSVRLSSSTPTSCQSSFPSAWPLKRVIFDIRRQAERLVNYWFHPVEHSAGNRDQILPTATTDDRTNGGSQEMLHLTLTRVREANTNWVKRIPSQGGGGQPWFLGDHQIVILYRAFICPLLHPWPISIPPSINVASATSLWVLSR